MTNTTGCPHIWEDGTESLAIRHPHTWDDGTEAVAIFSNNDNKKYRYLLEKIWKPGLPMLMFVMAHPSTATEKRNDRTIDMCEKRARNYHKVFGETEFGGLYVINIFAFVGTKVDCLKNVDAPIGTENYRMIQEYARKQDTKIVCAWGDKVNNPKFRNHLNDIKNILRQTAVEPLQYFKLTKQKQPRHISRFKANVDFKEWQV